METIAICASCGNEKHLCDSARINGIKQPRLCRNCLINYMSTGDSNINNVYWFMQMQQLNDTESLKLLKKSTVNSIQDTIKKQVNK